MLRNVAFITSCAALVAGCSVDSDNLTDPSLGSSQDPLIYLGRLSAPTVLSPSGTIADSPSDVHLTWRPLTTYSSYEIAVTQPDGTAVSIPSGWCDPTSTSCFIDFTPVLNGTYSFKVRGSQGATVSAWSSVKTFATTQPGTPTWIGATTVSGLSVGVDHSCALLANGTVRCWGPNGAMQLGDGTTALRSSPVFVGVLRGATAIAAAYGRSCAQVAGATLTCWGKRDLSDDRSPRPPTAFPALANVASITGSYWDSYAVLTNGTAVGWGSNIDGVVGNGTLSSYPAQPTAIVGLSGVSQIQSDGYHACATMSSGLVACWGGNDLGELGLGYADDTAHPTPKVIGLTGAAEVATSQHASCARMTNGSLKCWGGGMTTCLLGPGTNGSGCLASALRPTTLPSLQGVQQVVGGSTFFCARLANGGVSCWGKGDQVFGASAATAVPKAFLPMGVADDLKATFIAAAGRNVCAIVNSTSGKHGVVCWGEGSSGEDGNARTADRAAPGWALRKADTTCTGGDVVCPTCGGDDQMCCPTSNTCNSGFNCEVNTCRPCGAEGQACCASGSACGQADLVCSSGTCQACGGVGEPCCGGNTCGDHAQCVSGTCASCSGPGEACCTDETACETNLVCGQSSCGGCTSAISGGNAFACIIRNDHTLWCWGDNSTASLGTGDWNGQAVPVQITLPEPGPIMDVATGDQFACALSSTRKVYCWGAGRLNKTVVALPTDASVVALGAGGTQACATRSDGTVYCWEASNLLPRPMALPYVATRVAGGTHHACAATVANEVYCWGSNTRGQLGTGDLVSSDTPKRVIWLQSNPATGNAILQLRAGNSHTCVLQGDGSLWCWGDNQSGQLGTGAASTQPSPYPVRGAQTIPEMVVMSVGAFHTCATDPNGRVWCWGMNSMNQLGRTGDGTIPALVENLPEPIFELQAGAFGTCARSMHDVPWCWGAIYHQAMPVARVALACQ